MTPTTGELFWLATALSCLAAALTGFGLFAPHGPVLPRWRGHTQVLERLTTGMHRFGLGQRIAQLQAIALPLLLFLALAERSAPYALLFVATAALPLPVLRWLQRRRTKQMEDQLDDWLGSLGDMLAVVGSLSEAIAQSAPLTTPPLRQELEMVVKERRVGTSTPDCLASWVHRADSRLLASIVPVLVVGASSGGEYPRLIKRTADALRERKRLEQFVRKTTASGRFSLYLMAAMPVAFFYIGRELGPPFDATVLPQYGAIGYTILLLAAALWFASLVIGHRITRIDI